MCEMSIINSTSTSDTKQYNLVRAKWVMCAMTGDVTPDLTEIMIYGVVQRPPFS